VSRPNLEVYPEPVQRADEERRVLEFFRSNSTEDVARSG
jgi:hypothetical protein